MHILMEFCLFVLKILSGKNSDIRFIVWVNSITNVQKKCKNLNLDLVNITAYTNFGEILSIFSEDIERI